MKILVACECSGRVRDAFRKIGHDAYSCDTQPCETGNTANHYKEDVRLILNEGWDMMIAHPPCTYIAFSGIRWNVGNPERMKKHDEALNFVRLLLDANIPKIALENPIGVIPRHIRKWTQIIQPWQFGHEESKAHCLWLKNLPPLVPTQIMSVREQKIHKMAPGEDRQKNRSRTFSGIAQAMAEQWG